ncbi:uncharacterized protein SPAPADRAFT_55457 [Spathaspora passalidarum NRRL Y-27907]|uniref:Choline transport protein n=1 Tax=Spathaspora passalidarum (strain NRRL Y-27907 / 11-Y1) TaxID=619300 RepID=G3AKK6_SPAPN|nr:uncharacterized protein SPAPADRAFT_55457 [Spathaspora passalidarum NRRL Y-27907]EGW33611.1 hypothetical protein SPAPADRAFT_55457 [Spathaspora passalidarum NRRL Y-27907]
MSDLVGKKEPYIEIYHVPSHEDIPLDDKRTAHLLEEARANVEFAEESGYTPELTRRFSLISLLGVGFGLTNSWFGISAGLITSISSGGPMMIVYGTIVVAAMAACIGITLSEMASSMPNSGGQYYWTGKLAPKKWAPLMSYLCGSFAWIGSVFTSASITMSIATQIIGMSVLQNPQKTVKKWQVFLLFEAVNIFLLIFNIFERAQPYVSKSALFISLSSFFIIIITVLAMSGGEFQSASFVFSDFTNMTGWNSGAIAFFTGLVNPSWAFSCLDAATHIAEETTRPRTDIPKAICMTVVIGFITSFCFAIAMFFCMKNLDSIADSNTGVPIMDIFYSATSSKGAALGLQFLVLLTAVGCNISCHTWQARLCWSFSRDNGLPGSRWWSKVNTKTGSVVNSHLMSCAWSGVIGFVYLGSDTAFNSVMTCCVLFVAISYSIPTIFLVFDRSKLKPGPFYLKYNLGWYSNIITVGWTIFTFVFYNFPSVMPVAADNMNYACVVFAVIFGYCLLDWQLRAKMSFITNEQREQGRQELVKKLQVTSITSDVTITKSDC